MTYTKRLWNGTYKASKWGRLWKLLGCGLMWSKPMQKTRSLCICMFLFSKIWCQKYGENMVKTSPQLLLWCDNFAEHLRCCFLFVLELLEGCMNMLGTPPTFDASSFFLWNTNFWGIAPFEHISICAMVKSWIFDRLIEPTAAERHNRYAAHMKALRKKRHVANLHS